MIFIIRVTGNEVPLTTLEDGLGACAFKDRTVTMFATPAAISIYASSFFV